MYTKVMFMYNWYLTVSFWQLFYFCFFFSNALIIYPYIYYLASWCLATPPPPPPPTPLPPTVVRTAVMPNSYQAQSYAPSPSPVNNRFNTTNSPGPMDIYGSSQDQGMSGNFVPAASPQPTHGFGIGTQPVNIQINLWKFQKLFFLTQNINATSHA